MNMTSSTLECGAMLKQDSLLTHKIVDPYSSQIVSYCQAMKSTTNESACPSISGTYFTRRGYILPQI